MRIFLGRWLPEYWQMVEKKETCCWMRRDNNALVLFPNLKKISFKLERKHENHLWVEERSFWKEEVKSCHASSEEKRNAKSNQGIHVSCRTSVLTWDWIGIGECQARRGNSVLQQEFRSHLDNSSRDRRTRVGCQTCW